MFLAVVKKMLWSHFLIFAFFPFLQGLKSAKKVIFQQNRNFLTKIQLFCTFWQKSKNWLHIIFITTPRNIITNFQTNRTIFQGLVAILLRNQGVTCGAKNTRKTPLFGNKTQIFGPIFPKFSESIKPILITYFDQVLGHFEHFWAQYGYFWVILAHFR